MKTLKDEIAAWPPEVQPGEAELRELLSKRLVAQVAEASRQKQLRWLRERGYLRDAS